MTHAAVKLAIAWLLVACGPAAGPQPARGVVLIRPAPAPPALRLGSHVRPTRYRVELTIEPTRETFDGSVAITLAIDEPVDVIWLHVAALSISTAEVRVAGARIAVRPIASTPAIADRELVGLRLERSIGPGTAELAIAYRGELSATETRGMYRRVDRGESYVFTQLQPTGARRVLPCFDEPSFKVPFQLAVRVQPQDVAVSNTPIEHERVDGRGTKTVRFAETPPLPPYLLAIAVGPFEIVDAGRAGRRDTRSASSFREDARGPPILLIPPGARVENRRFDARTS